MTAPSSLVTALANVLSLLQSDPDDRERLKAAFRDLYGIIEPAGATLSIDVSGLLMDGTPLPHGIPGADEVHVRFHAHGVGSMRVQGGGETDKTPPPPTPPPPKQNKTPLPPSL